MTSPRVREAPPPLRRRFRPRQIAIATVATAAAIGVGMVLVGALSGPSQIDELTVNNPTAFPLGVQVSSGDDSWLGLGNVPAGSEHTFQSVTDQGDIWVFEFEYAGESVARVQVSRASLSGDDWELSVPEEAGERLRELGRVAPPRG